MGARAGAGAGASQKWSGSATLPVWAYRPVVYLLLESFRKRRQSFEAKNNGTYRETKQYFKVKSGVLRSDRDPVRKQKPRGYRQLVNWKLVRFLLYRFANCFSCCQGCTVSRVRCAVCGVLLLLQLVSKENICPSHCRDSCLCESFFVLLSVHFIISVLRSQRRLRLHLLGKQNKNPVLWNGTKYIEFGSGSRILAQFGSGSRVIQSILKEKIQNKFREK